MADADGRTRDPADDRDLDKLDKTFPPPTHKKSLEMI
jgi:hypothetical protein